MAIRSGKIQLKLQKRFLIRTLWHFKSQNVIKYRLASGNINYFRSLAISRQLPSSYLLISVPNKRAEIFKQRTNMQSVSTQVNKQSSTAVKNSTQRGQSPNQPSQVSDALQRSLYVVTASSPTTTEQQATQAAASSNSLNRRSTPSPSRTCQDGGSGATSDESCLSRRKHECTNQFGANQVDTELVTLPVTQEVSIDLASEKFENSESQKSVRIAIEPANTQLRQIKTCLQPQESAANQSFQRRVQLQESIDSHTRSDLVTPYFKLRHSRTELNTNGSSLNDEHTLKIDSNKSKEVLAQHHKMMLNADFTQIASAKISNGTFDRQKLYKLSTDRPKHRAERLLPASQGTGSVQDSIQLDGQATSDQKQLFDDLKQNRTEDEGAQPLYQYSLSKSPDCLDLSAQSPTLTYDNPPMSLPEDGAEKRKYSPSTFHELKTRLARQSTLFDYPQKHSQQLLIRFRTGLYSRGSPLLPSYKGSLIDLSNSNECARTIDLRKAVCTSRSLGKPSCRYHHMLTLQGDDDEKKPKVYSFHQRSQPYGSRHGHHHLRRLYDNSSLINNKQNGMEMVLNLEKCREPSLQSASFGSDCFEEGKDHIYEIPSRDRGSKGETQHPINRLRKHQPHSSQSLINFSDREVNRCYRNHIFEYDSDAKSPCTSPVRRDAAKSQNGDSIWNLEPMRRSTSLGKRAMLDLGRSPQVPFVQNLRTTFKRNSSQRLFLRRNISPPDHHTTNYGGGVSENNRSRRRASFGKSDSAKKRRQVQLCNEQAAAADSQAEKMSHSQISSTNTTPLYPSDIFKKYEDFPDQSLKLSVYKDVSVQIIQAVNIVQQIKQFPAISPSSKINFQFKKKGFNKLLIFDLDETLIHSMRDEDEPEYMELAVHYEENEPDMWVQMESPSSEYGSFPQGVYIRPYLHECLRAANIDYEVAVFTAGFDWYASPIIDKIDPTGTLIQHRFFRQHAQTITYKGQESLYKDLSVFQGIDLSRTLIVDNQVFSFATHLSNGVPIAGFYGGKQDSELIKVMKYVHQIAGEEDLQQANERQFGLQAMLNIPIDKFAKYYQIDEMSESDENDFEEDGNTLHSSARRKVAKIFRQKNEEDGDSSEIAVDDESQESYKMRLNVTLGHEDQEDVCSDGNRGQGRNQQHQKRGNVQSSKLLRLFSVAPTSLSPQYQTQQEVAMIRHSFEQHQVELPGILSIDDPYTRISKKDEGNIGGTLSNAHQSTKNEPRNTSPGHTDNTSTVIQFAEAMRHDDEPDNYLRRPQIHLSGTTDGVVANNAETQNLPVSPQLQAATKFTSGKQKNQAEAAVSSYHKVCLTSEKARRRQNSSGQRSSQQIDLNTANCYFSPVIAARKAARVGGASGNLQRGGFVRGAFGNSNASAQEAVNNYYQQVKLTRLPSDQQRGKGSDSYRGIARDPSEGKETITFADIVEMEQKTLTSVKKANKGSVAPSATGKTLRSDARTDAKNLKRAGTPSEAFMSQVVRNVNNTLKPPNWTKRKQQLLRRNQSLAEQPLASNIDYHLDQLANIYKQGGVKAREGAEPSLMEQLLEANPQNASFLTPSSSSLVTPSLLSGNKHFTRISSCHSMDKYQQLKNSVNRQGLSSSMKLRKTLFQQKSANLAVFVNKGEQQYGSSESPDVASQRSSSSPNVFQMKTQKVAAVCSSTKVVGSGLLPPRPSQPAAQQPAGKAKQAARTHKTQIGGSMGRIPAMKHQHSSPEKELRHSLLLMEESEDRQLRVLEEALAGELKPGKQVSQAQGRVGDTILACSQSDLHTTGEGR